MKDAKRCRCSSTVRSGNSTLCCTHMHNRRAGRQAGRAGRAGRQTEQAGRRTGSGRGEGAGRQGREAAGRQCRPGDPFWLAAELVNRPTCLRADAQVLSDVLHVRPAPHESTDRMVMVMMMMMMMMMTTVG